jgi:hypothetical protein
MISKTIDDVVKIDKSAQVFERQNQARIKAHSKCDYPAYARLCNELGLEPEFPEDYQTGLAEIAMRATIKKDEESDKKYELYSEFLRQSGKKLEYLPDAIFKDTQAKIELLKLLGYTYLKGPDKKGIPLNQCADERIGKAYWNCRKAAENYVKASR